MSRVQLVFIERACITGTVKNKNRTHTSRRRHSGRPGAGIRVVRQSKGLGWEVGHEGSSRIIVRAALGKRRADGPYDDN